MLNIYDLFKMRVFTIHFFIMQFLAACLSSAGFFHNLLYPGDLWWISIIGFAVIVGLMFRIASTYDARERPSCWLFHYIGAFILAAEIILVVCHQLGISRNISEVVYLTWFGLLLLSDVYVTTKMLLQGHLSFAEAKSPWLIAYLRIVVWALSGTIHFAHLSEGLTVCLVLFASYTNCLHFVANAYGLLREGTVSASNGSLFTRFKEYCASILDDFDKRTLVFLSLLIVVVIYALMFEFFLITPERFWIIPHALYAVLCTASFQWLDKYDPRKPPERDVLVLRKQRAMAFFMNCLFVFSLYWIRMPLVVTTYEVKIAISCLTNAIFIFRFVAMLKLQQLEIPYLKYVSKTTLWNKIVEMTVMLIACVLSILNLVDGVQTVSFLGFAFLRSFIFMSTVYTVQVIYGEFRDPVRQESPQIAEPPVAVVAPLQETENSFEIV